MSIALDVPCRQNAQSRVSEKLKYHQTLVNGWGTLLELIEDISPEKEAHINELLNHLRIWEVK